MFVFSITGLIFGLFGFIFGLSAWHKIEKLETELKRRQILDENFNSDQ